MSNHRMRVTISILIFALLLLPSTAFAAGRSLPKLRSLPVTSRQAAKKNPALQVEGNHLTDGKGHTVRLKGVSTHGLAWYPQYINKKAFKRLRDDWKANTIRLALYTEEYNGYLTGGDQAAQRKLIDKGVRYATELGMYVIIDWHILNDNNPGTHLKEAKSFFKTMAKKYRNHTNVLFEVCNEPHWVSWEQDIRPYAAKITKVIRKYNKNAVIIVGTNTWSQDVDDVIGHRLKDKNTVYTFHFYAATHGDDLRHKLESALSAGIPVFVSECSICDASGNGGIDKASASQWFSLLDRYQVSYVAWNLSNKDETSALINSGCSKLSGWKTSDLSDTGKWFRKRMRRK